MKILSLIALIGIAVPLVTCSSCSDSEGSSGSGADEDPFMHLVGHYQLICDNETDVDIKVEDLLLLTGPIRDTCPGELPVLNVTKTEEGSSASGKKKAKEMDFYKFCSELIDLKDELTAMAPPPANNTEEVAAEDPTLLEEAVDVAEDAAEDTAAEEVVDEAADLLLGDEEAVVEEVVEEEPVSPEAEFAGLMLDAVPSCEAYLLKFSELGPGNSFNAKASGKKEKKEKKEKAPKEKKEKKAKKAKKGRK